MVLGILAHVDAGKTTLSEAMLYASGNIRKLGRVDNKDAFLDNYELERKRGITIFSKQALFSYAGKQMTLLDTPGHVDFSAEMERTLQVLDVAVLVVSASDGVQGHTRTLWRLLKRYEVPTFIFVNKMDMPDIDKEKIMSELSEELDSSCVDFGQEDIAIFHENLAMCDEKMMNSFLDSGEIEMLDIKRAIRERKVFPCFFGSALKLQGVEELLAGLSQHISEQTYPKQFGARVFKITRDSQGNRLTHLKITGGCLKAKEELSGKERESDTVWTEKVNQIRLYNGEKFEPVSEAVAGDVYAVTGLTKTYPGQGLGAEKETLLPSLEPVLNYRIILPDGMDTAVMLPKLRLLEEEDPMLSIDFLEELNEIHAKVMGDVQIEVLQSLIKERFGVEVSFGAGKIVYKETIACEVEGVGHFEPLRHYAEVHLLLEPLEYGSGLIVEADCSEDMLSRNWQRLILTHLEERQHRGVLTGSVITDMKLTLVSGKAHLKHTEGGDFRQATYRAVRQGLMEAQSILLEPIYEFRLEIPDESIGRAMTDVEKMHGKCTLEQRGGKMALLTGTAPVVTMRDYQKEVTAYTKGEGKLSLSLKGYAPCHNTEEVMESIGYNPERDLRNTPDSVFCAHGAGFVVPWNEVKEHMHLESFLAHTGKRAENDSQDITIRKHPESTDEMFIGTEEIDAILNKTTHANSRRDGNKKKEGWQREHRKGTYQESTGSSAVTRVYKGQEKKESYLLVDGYNIIFAWDDLKELAQHNLDSARGKLLDILCNYQGMKHCHLIAVFDAYRVQGHPTEILDYHNIHVVYTKEAETADQYIEKFAHENGKKYDVTVATSDGLEQIIIRSQGCRLLSARDLLEDINLLSKQLKENYLEKQTSPKRYLLDDVSDEVNKWLWD